VSLAANLPPPPPPRPRRIGEIFAVSLRAYGRWWTELVPLAAIFVVPAQLILLLIDRLLVGIEGPGGPGAATSGPAALVALLGVLASVALGTAEQGALTWAAMRALLELEPPLGRAARMGLRRFWSVLLLSLLVGLSVGLGLVLLVVPGLVVLVRLAVVMPVLFVEDLRGRAALRRSWALVRGRSWAVAGVLLLAGFVGGLASVAGSELVALLGLPREIGGVVASILVSPLAALLAGAVYIDLRARELATAPVLAAELERASS
jgi:hypothetical protein